LGKLAEVAVHANSPRWLGVADTVAPYETREFKSGDATDELKKSRQAAADVGHRSIHEEAVVKWYNRPVMSLIRRYLNQLVT